jgi:hypothetical protein
LISAHTHADGGAASAATSAAARGNCVRMCASAGAALGGARRTARRMAASWCRSSGDTMSSTSRLKDSGFVRQHANDIEKARSATTLRTR